MTIISEDSKDIIPLLKEGAIGVLPTDTIYGIVTSANKKSSVEKIYSLKNRNPAKPLIVLISSKADLKKFDIKLSKEQEKELSQVFSKTGPTSVILPCSSSKFKYLHRGTKSLAFRLPKDKELLSIIRAVGPLVAPSANLEGELPAQNIEIAQQYFGNKIAFYLNKGPRQSKASAIIRLKEDGSKEFVRQN